MLGSSKVHKVINSDHNNKAVWKNSFAYIYP